MNDQLFDNNNIFDTVDSLEQYRYSGKIFTGKFLRQFSVVLLAKLSALILMTVDGAIVSRFVGTDALNSVNLLQPFVMVMSVIPALLASGVNFVLPLKFGIGSEKAVKRVLAATTFLTVVLMIGSLIVQIPIAYLMISGYSVDSEIRHMMSLYAVGLIISNSVSVVTVVCSSILTASGQAKALLKLSILESVLNFVLDILFVPICGLGVFGAGLGTAVSCTVRAIVSPILIHKIFKVFPIKRMDCRAEMRELLSTGAPTAYSSLALHGMSYIMNLAVTRFAGMEGVTVLSVCEIGISFIWLFGDSFLQAGNPMVGILAGSGEWKAARDVNRRVMVMCVSAVTGLVLLFVLFPQMLFDFYNVREYTAFQVTSVRLYMVKSIAIAGAGFVTNMCVYCGKKSMTAVAGILKAMLLAPMFLILRWVSIDLSFLCYFICEAVPICILCPVLIRALHSLTAEENKNSRIHFSFRKNEAIDISEKLRNYLLLHDVQEKFAYRLALLCEELGSYAEKEKGCTEPHIFLSIQKTEDSVIVFYLDDGVPAIMNKKLKATNLILGNYNLIESMAEQFTYQNVGGMNNFIVKFKL